jgi:hypothetical protein
MARSLRLAVIERVAERGAADGPIPAAFTPAADGRGGRIAFSNVGSSLQLSPTADCRSVGRIPASAKKSSCCQPAAPSTRERNNIMGAQPQCAHIGGAGACYTVMAIKRLIGLDGPECCAACAAEPKCGAWEVIIGTKSICALKPYGNYKRPCDDPGRRSLPNTSSSGASGFNPAPPTGGARAGFPFELRAQDGSYLTARATVEGATVTLTPVNDDDHGSTSTGPFIGYRYAWQPFPLCVLTNGEGLPAAPTLV